MIYSVSKDEANIGVLRNKRLTDQDTGTGLGLSIIKRVIEKYQGYPEVFSQPGLGTEFKVYLKISL